MIKGKTKERVSAQKILQQVHPYEIFRYYLGRDFRLGKAFASPFRKDVHPSFSISMAGGEPYFVDFSQSSVRGDCFDFVQLMYSLSFDEALKLIDRDFGLGLESGKPFNIRKAPVYKLPEMAERKPSFIQFTGNQKFNRADESKYWNDYHFSFDILKREHTYCVRSLFIDRQKMALPKDEPIFAYYEPSIDAVKIYRPFANKKRKEWKWRSTIPFTFMHGLGEMQACEKIVTFKSNKDRICGLHFLPQALAAQAESFAAFSVDSLTKINALAREHYICFGTDEQGKRESLLITSQLGIGHINMPDYYLPANDPAEVAKTHSIATVEQHFIEKGIIQQYLKTG